MGTITLNEEQLATVCVRFVDAWEEELKGGRPYADEERTQPTCCLVCALSVIYDRLWLMGIENDIENHPAMVEKEADPQKPCACLPEYFAQPQ